VLGQDQHVPAALHVLIELERRARVQIARTRDDDEPEPVQLGLCPVSRGAVGEVRQLDDAMSRGERCARDSNRAGRCAWPGRGSAPQPRRR
jgi:hypothetical protein